MPGGLIEKCGCSNMNRRSFNVLNKCAGLSGLDEHFWSGFTKIAEISSAKDGGAVERNKLEPESLELLLSELEQWQAVLEADPEITAKLETFREDAGSKPLCQASSRPKRKLRGPSP